MFQAREFIFLIKKNPKSIQTTSNSEKGLYSSSLSFERGKNYFLSQMFDISIETWKIILCGIIWFLYVTMATHSIH